MDSFQTKLRVKTIKSDLQRLPRGLEAYDVAYEDAMRRIFDQGSECQETAKRILSLVLCAGRPLKTLEIQSALMIEPGDADLDQEDTLDPEDILSICAGLIKIDESSETIGFVHYTTQEYLERTQGLWLPRAEFEIARTCLDYLLAVPSVINSGTSQKTGLTFTSYAVQHGPFHWNAAMPNESSQHAALLSLLARPHILTAMWQKCAHRKLREGGGTFVHLIALLGLADLMKFCIDRGFDHDTKNTFGRTPLSYAAQEGHRQVVRLLLERGATIDSTDHDDRTPLMYAVTGKGHYDTHAFCLTLLTRERAVPSTIQANVRFDPTDMPSILPPSHAVPESESFTALRLVEPDLFVDIGNGNDQPQTVGTAAVSRQCQLFTRSPSGYGAILNSRSKSTVPVRSNSTRTGYGPVIKLLLERGALQAERQTFPCHFSAHLVGIVDILNNYAGIFGPYKGSGTTALRSTATDDRLAVVKSLLSKGANLNVTDKYGWGSLNYATIASNYDIVEILCGVGGVDVNITDVVGQTPLFYAELLQEILDKSRPYHNICEKLRPTWIGDLRFW
jgi:ankyrin repeat protein